MTSATKIHCRRPRYNAIRALRGKSPKRMTEKEVDAELWKLAKQMVDTHKQFFLGSSGEDSKE